MKKKTEKQPIGKTNRRQYVRFPSMCRVEYGTNDGRNAFAFTSDLSAGGMFLRSAKKLPTNGPVEFTIHLGQSKESVAVTGNVRRVESGAGVEFALEGQSAEAKIRKYIVGNVFNHLYEKVKVTGGPVKTVALLAAYLRETGKPDEALDVYRTALSRRSQNIELYEALAKSLCQRVADTNGSDTALVRELGKLVARGLTMGPNATLESCNEIVARYGTHGKQRRRQTLRQERQRLEKSYADQLKTIEHQMQHRIDEEVERILTEKTSELRFEQNTARRATSKISEELKELEASLERSKGEINERETSLTRKEDTVRHDLKKLEEQRQEWQKSQSTRETTLEEREKNLGTAEALKKQLDRLYSKNNKLRERIKDADGREKVAIQASTDALEIAKKELEEVQNRASLAEVCVKEQHEQLGELRKELTTLDQEHTDKVQELAHARTLAARAGQVKELEAKLAEISGERSEINDSLEEAEKRHRELLDAKENECIRSKKALGKARTQALKANKKLGVTHKELDSLRSQMDSMETALGERGRELDTARERASGVTRLETTVKELSGDNEDLRNQLNETLVLAQRAENVEKLEQQLRTLNETNETLQTELGDALVHAQRAEQVDHLENQLGQLAEAKKELVSKLDAAEAERAERIQGLEAQLEALLDSNGQLRNELDESQAQTKRAKLEMDLEEQIDLITRENGALNDRLVDDERRYVAILYAKEQDEFTLKQALGAARMELEEAEHIINERSDEVAALTSETDRLGQVLIARDTDLQNAQREIADLAQQNVAIKGKLQRAEQDRAAANLSTGDNSESIELLQRVRADLTSSESIVAAQQNEIDNLRNKIVSLSEELANTINELEILRTQPEVSETEAEAVRELRLQMEQLCDENRDLQTELASTTIEALAKHKSLEGEIEEFQRNFVTKEGTLQSAENRLRLQLGQINRLKEQNGLLETDLVEQARESQNADELAVQAARAEALGAELDQERAAAKKLSDELNDQQSAAKKLSGELSDQRTAARKLANDLHKQKTAARTLSDDLYNERNAATKLNAQLGDQQNLAKTTHENLRKAQNLLNAEQTSWKKQEGNLRSENQALQSQIADLESSLGRAREEIVKFQANPTHAQENMQPHIDLWARRATLIETRLVEQKELLERIESRIENTRVDTPIPFALSAPKTFESSRVSPATVTKINERFERTEPDMMLHSEPLDLNFSTGPRLRVYAAAAAVILVVAVKFWGGAEAPAQTAKVVAAGMTPIPAAPIVPEQAESTATKTPVKQASVAKLVQPKTKVVAKAKAAKKVTTTKKRMRFTKSKKQPARKKQFRARKSKNKKPRSSPKIAAAEGGEVDALFDDFFR